MIKLLQTIRKRFSNRPDTEHQQAFIRMVLGIGILAYFGPTSFRQGALHVFATEVALVCYVCAVPIWIYLRPGISHPRRYITAAADIAFLTLAMLWHGESALAIYPFFIVITVAGGFRYGSKNLLVNMGVGIAGLALASVFSGSFTMRSIMFELIGAYVAVCLYFNALVKKLFAAVLAANQASDAKRMFLSNMSHELRTPLHAIAGLTDMMKRSTSVEQIGVIRNSLQAAVDSMLHLCTDVLDFSKIEAGKTEIAEKPFDVFKLMADTERIFAPAAAVKGISLHFHLGLEVPVDMIGDRGHISQILNNLVANAIKFTASGSVSVSLSCHNPEDARATLRWTVQDSGIGIEKDKQAKIFESFTQADAGVALQYGGTGLGTTIAKELTTMMGGRIGLVSEKNVGSTFWFEIPLMAAPAQEREPASGFRICFLPPAHAPAESLKRALDMHLAGCSISPQALENRIEQSDLHPFGLLAPAENGRLTPEVRSALLKKIPVIVYSDTALSPEQKTNLQRSGVLSTMDNAADVPKAISLLHCWSKQNNPSSSSRSPARTILIADDNETNLMILREALTNEGHVVHAAKDGKEALALLKEVEADLVILDMNMPRLDGIETTRIIRTLPQDISKVPIAMLTADATSDARTRATNAGVTLFIAKPVKSHVIMEQIARIFSDARGAAETEPLADTAETPARTPRTINMRVIDGLRRMSADCDFFSDLVTLYLDDTRKRLATLQAAVAQENYDDWQHGVHTLKGSAKDLGLEKMVATLESAKQIEPSMLAACGHAIYRKIEEEFKAVEPALRALA